MVSKFRATIQDASLNAVLGNITSEDCERIIAKLFCEVDVDALSVEDQDLFYALERSVTGDPLIPFSNDDVMAELAAFSG